jgi:hypothetical protein
MTASNFEFKDSPGKAPVNSTASEGERIRNNPSSLRIGALLWRASISDPQGKSDQARFARYRIQAKADNKVFCHELLADES